MNNKKTNLKLIEKISFQVPNTASISKSIFFYVSKFLEKMMFQLTFGVRYTKSTNSKDDKITC